MNEEASKSFANLSPDEKRALLARLLREKAKVGQTSLDDGAGASVDGRAVGSSPPVGGSLDNGASASADGKAGSPDGKVAEVQEWSPLSHGQRALWFLYRLSPDSTAYNLLYTARVSSALDIPTLQHSLQALVRRYPILTATYTMQGNEPVQRFHPQQQIQAEVIDASSWSTAELDQRLSEEGNRPFDLEKGPILRIQLFQRSTPEAILALTVHPI